MDCTCCRCGKVFDYEKYYGICPKCAAYNKRGGTQDNYSIDEAFTARYDVEEDSCKSLHEQYDSASGHQSQKQHAEYHRNYDTMKMPQSHYGQPQYSRPQMQSGQNYTTEAPKKKSGAKWFVIFFVIMFVLILGVGIYMSNRDSINKMLGIGGMDEPPARVDIAAGASISNDDITICADEIVVIGDSNALSFVPEYEMLVAVHASVTSNGGSDARKMEAPMLACDGIYRECLGDFDVEYYVLDEIAYSGITEDDLLSEYLYMNYSEDGYFFYFIPADAESISVVIEELKNSDSDRVVKQYWMQPPVRELSVESDSTLRQEGL